MLLFSTSHLAGVISYRVGVGVASFSICSAGVGPFSTGDVAAVPFLTGGERVVSVSTGGLGVVPLSTVDICVRFGDVTSVAVFIIR